MTQLRDPINVKILDPKKYITKNGCLPVSSHQIYEPSSLTFHPEGLFSEVIFGQVGATDRLYRRGFIDLRTKVFQPLIYNIIISLKAMYSEVISGKLYARYDKDLKELVRADMMEPGAGTGFMFFMKHFANIEFKETDSLKRKDKLAILAKYKDNLLIDKYLVIPAGVRDIKEENGRLSSEDINKIYLSLLSLSQAMPEQIDDNAIFDALRFNIQMRVVQVYDYLENLVTGKKGFAMGRFSARSVALANRNVITSPPLSNVLSPNDPKYFKADETLVPLFQIAKAMTPAMVHALRDTFFSQVFDADSVNFSLIDPKTLELQYVKVADTDRAMYTTTDGVTKLINLFRNENIRHLPAAIKDEHNQFKYLYLVYDLGDSVYFLRNKGDFADQLTGRASWGIGTIKHLDLFEKYDIKKDEAVISGSAALIAHGYQGDNEDLDVTVSKATFDRLIKEFGFTKKETTKDTPVYLDPTGNMEIMYFSPVAQLEYEKVKVIADEIDGYLFDSLSTLQMGYRLSPVLRPKDKPKLRWLMKKVFDPKYLRPLTYMEMFYVAAYKVVNINQPPKHVTATRYPILNVFGILPTRINIQTTEPNRTVTLKHPTQPLNIVLPRYPILKATSQDSMCAHPSTNEGYQSDYDGDTMSLIGVLSDEANQEIENFLHVPMSMINSSGKLNTGLVCCKIGAYTYYNLSKDPKEKIYI